jgi:hypothetical protein
VESLSYRINPSFPHSLVGTIFTISRIFYLYRFLIKDRGKCSFSGYDAPENTIQYFIPLLLKEKSNTWVNPMIIIHQ